MGRRNRFVNRWMVLAAICLAMVCSGRSAFADLPAHYRGPRTANVYQPLATAPGADGAPQRQAPIHVEPISADQRREFHINPFYTRTLCIDGIPVIGSDRVSDFAFLECAYTLDHMLQNSPERVKQALVAAHAQMGIIAVVEYTMDIPENQTSRNMRPAEAAFQDRRSRGLGGLPLSTCAEENLLNLRGDPYNVEDIMIHEFSHTIASAIRESDPQWYAKLKETYRQAMADGLFAHSYSATNEQEYWAEGAQAWFDCAAVRKDPTVHSGIWNREQVKSYDPRLAALLAEIYGDGDWRYVKTTNEPVNAGGRTYIRPAEGMSHLRGLDRNQFPVFDFENSPRIRAAGRSR